MENRLDVFFCGPQADSAASRPTRDTVRFIAREDLSLKVAPADELNRIVRESDAELFAFAEDASPADPLAFQQAADLLLERQRDAAGAVLAVEDESIPLNLWRSLPASVAVLIHRPGPLMIAVHRRESFDRSGGFANVPAPAWDWLIRTARDGGELLMTDARRDESVEFPPAAADELPPLVPGRPGRERHWLQNHLNEVRPEQFVPDAKSQPDAVAFKAGLYLLHDFLDESHQLSQSVEGDGRHHAGDYWHALMHRREPDFSNSKYWFRRVGEHPVFPELARHADGILKTHAGQSAPEWAARLQVPHRWDPFAFVDLCQECQGSADRALADAARRIQWIEMLLLLNQTYRDATD